MSATLTCSVCETGFRGRSDAVYCSAGCRQKAHRRRTARRVAAWAEPDGPSPRRPERTVTKSEVAAMHRRAQEERDRARSLCSTAADARLRAQLASRTGDVLAGERP